MSDYTSKDIVVLDEIEHIKINPSMYISSTETPTHLVEEVLDNSLDEAMGGYANVIAILIDSKEFIYSVIDDGRGVPLTDNVPFIISTKLHSGGKFKGKKTAYANATCGLHGIGLVAVNALCDMYTLEIYRNQKHVKLVFKNAKLHQKIEEDFKEQVPFSTKVQFKPSKSIFQSLVPDIDRLRRRLSVASLELPKCTFVLNVDGNKEIIKTSKDEFFKFQCLNETDTEISQTFNLNSKIGPEEFNATFTYSFNGSVSPKYISSVNLLPVDEGGSHVLVFNDILRDFFINKAKKLNKIFQPGDVFCGLRSYLSLKLMKPDFSGQSKGKLNNRKDDFILLANKLKQELESVFNKNPEQLENILNFFDDYRKKLNHKKTNSTNGRRVSTKFTKLADCISRNGELFIVEGDSAGGSFKQCRDPNIHAILPLKGKIPSVVNKKEILKHNEVHELIESLGTGSGPHFKLENLKYDKIICAADADEDGKHIFCLLTIILASLVPEIIKAGKYFLAETPLYAITNNKNIFIPLWTKEELFKARNEGKNITRIKGLGELDPWMLKICALDVPTRRLIQVKYTDNLEKMLELFENKDRKRELLSGEWKI